jgi:hypothetical protein
MIKIEIRTKLLMFVLSAYPDIKGIVFDIATLPTGF